MQAGSGNCMRRGFHTGKWRSFTVCRTSQKFLNMCLKKEGIPFEVSLKKTVKDIPVLDWLIRVLRFSVNPKDKNSGIVALADKRYGLGMSVKEAEKTINILSETRKTQTEILKSEKCEKRIRHL